MTERPNPADAFLVQELVERFGLPECPRCHRDRDDRETAVLFQGWELVLGEGIVCPGCVEDGDKLATESLRDLLIFDFAQRTGNTEDEVRAMIPERRTE